jgi:subfamily B ATP-binding cassette protein MsbA
MGFAKKVADTVVFMDGGRIVEQGSHAQLLATGGLYAHLHRIQFSASAAAQLSPIP